MYQIHCLNKISPAGTDRLGENYTMGPPFRRVKGSTVTCIVFVPPKA